MTLHTRRDGTGSPLLLVHGLGSNAAAWDMVMPLLSGERSVIRIDLPGHGQSPAQDDSGTWAGQVRALEAFLRDAGLTGVAMAGFSLGGRLVLEMARKGLSGPVVALGPSGFWEGWERAYARGVLKASIAMLRTAPAAVPAIAHNAVPRAAVLGLISAQTWRVPGEVAEAELRAYLGCSVFDALLEDVSVAPVQAGPSAPGSGPVTIGWGCHDRLTLPVQAARAARAFPEARLHWFEGSGHYTLWDEPEAVAALILEGTA